jgi:hypothetical protein
VARIVVVLPLQPGAAGEARSLLRPGLPVEPPAGSLQRCAVYLSDREAIVLLEGPGVHALVPRWEAVSSWTEGHRWAGLLRSDPRIAELISAWEEPPDLEGLSFGPLPGPGDSEGGDATAP